MWCNATHLESIEAGKVVILAVGSSVSMICEHAPDHP